MHVSNPLGNASISNYGLVCLITKVAQNVLWPYLNAFLQARVNRIAKSFNIILFFVHLLNHQLQLIGPQHR